jgi:hypothetical protein
MLGSPAVHGDEREVDLRFESGGELDLGLLCGLLQTLESHLVLGQVYALLAAKLFRDPIDDALIDVVSAQMGIAVGGLDLDDAFADLQDGNIESTAAEIEDRDGLVLLLVQTVGQRRRGGLVDDALDVQAGDGTGVFRRLSLGVIEVSRYGNHGVHDLCAQVIFGRLPQLL